MPLALSVYFDLVRVLAALVVLISHAWLTFVPHHPLPWPGHQAVGRLSVGKGILIGVGWFRYANAAPLVQPVRGPCLC